MIVKWYILSVVLIFTLSIKRIKSDETVITINSKRTLHIVSEQFVSISVDPAILLSNLNISTKSLSLASALAPAFIRITGASTNLIRWSDDKNDNASKYKQIPNEYTINSEQWVDLNEWILNANLTPIFALNGHIRINNTIWDPRESLAIMTLTDKLNYSCFWELGYDCNTTLAQYVSDITSLQHIMDAFPTSKDYWGIVGSDISGCLADDTFETIKNFFLSVEDLLDAINWHAKMVDDELLFKEKDLIIRALSPLAKTKLPVMVTVPRSGKGITFADGLTWAIQMGDAAKYGFGVIFRQPRIREFFQETPAFWISLVHKHLMGRNVLDVKSTISNRTHNYIYAHCSRKQNSFIHRGAMTLFAVNPQEEVLDIDIKFLGTHVRSIEVQSYILTSNGDIYDNEIFLNAEKMTPETFIKNGKLEISPKIRRAHGNRFITLSLIANSIGFFVFPGVRLPACVAGEDDTDLIVEEISEDQNLQMPILNNNYETDEEKAEKLLSEDLKTFTLQNEILRQMVHRKKIDESDERYNIEHGFKSMKKATEKHSNDKSIHTGIENHNTNEIRQHFIDHAKLIDRRRKIHDIEHNKFDLRHKLQEKIKAEKKSKIDIKNKDAYNIELTSDEIKKVLSERTKIQPNLSDDMKHMIAKKSGKSLETVSGEDTETDRPKRFLPVDMMKDFVEKKSEKSKNNNTDTKVVSRRKRQIDFGMTNRKRSRVVENIRNRKRTNENDENDEEEYYFGPNNKFFLDHSVTVSKEKKKTEYFPQGDIYMDVKSDSSMEKNENYDYVDSDEVLSNEDAISDNHFKLRDEDLDIRMPISYAQMDNPNLHKNVRDKIQKNNRETKIGRNSRGRVDNIGNEGMDLATTTQTNTWSQFDNDKYYHAPEFYENFHKDSVNIRDDLRVYGELWEIDNMKEASDHGNTDVFLIDNHSQEDSNERVRNQQLLDDYIKSLKRSSEQINDGPVRLFEKDESEEESEEEQNSSAMFNNYEEPKIILKRSNIPEDEPNDTETKIVDHVINEKNEMKKKKKTKKTSTNVLTTTIPPTEAQNEYEETSVTFKPKKKKQKVTEEKTEQVTPDYCKREIKQNSYNDIDASNRISLENIFGLNMKHLNEYQRNIKENEVRIKRDTNMYYDDNYNMNHSKNRKRRDEMLKESIKEFKNSVKQKHDIERRIRKADHQEEKRVLKQLKSRHRRNAEVMSMDRISSEFSDNFEEKNNYKNILYPDKEFAESSKEINIALCAENEPKTSDLIENKMNSNEESFTTESPQNTFTMEEDDDCVTPTDEGPFKFIIGRPLDQIKLKPLNERRISNFQKYLKTRLARQKKRTEKIKPIQKIEIIVLCSLKIQ